MTLTIRVQKNYSEHGIIESQKLKGLAYYIIIGNYTLLIIIGREDYELTKLDGMMDIPNESSSSDTTAPVLTLKLYPRT